MARSSGETPVAGWDEGRLYVAFLPSLAILLPAALSVLAWTLPPSEGGLTGYFHRAPVSAWGVALVVAWFAALVAAGQIGFSAGRRRGGFSSLNHVALHEVHVATALVGAIGTVWAYWNATGGSPSRILALWQEQQFNILRQGLEYGAGFSTLRYATIIAGGLSIAHLLRRSRPRLIDALSLAGLLACAFLNSRLALIAAIFVALAVLLTSSRQHRVRWLPVVASLILGCCLLTALNYSRNANTYREAGITNPFQMAMVNGQSYLASPTQVTLAFSTLVMDGEINPPLGTVDSAAAILLPTYATNLAAEPVAIHSVSTVVDVNRSLTTNGALSSLLFERDWLSLILALPVVAAFAWAAGRFLSSSSVGPAVAGAILYGFAELWRIFLFNQGIFHFLALIGVVTVAVGWIRRYQLGASTERAIR